MERIRILHLEDSEDDAVLIERELKKGGLEFDIFHAEERASFVNALHSFHPDVILSDHSLPGFDSTEALAIVKSNGRNIPFILVTATMTEYFAVEVLKSGAADYILKDRLQRLPNAIVTAIQNHKNEMEAAWRLEELHRNEKKFRALLENSYDAIVIRDEQFKATYFSPSALRILGWNESDNSDTDFMNSIHAEDREIVDAIRKEILNHPGRPYFMTFRKKHRKGHYVWVEGVMTNLIQNPAIKGIVSNFRDITERHEAEEEKNQLVAQLIERNNDLTQFSYVASHNLRGPVASMLGLVRLLETTHKEEESMLVRQHMRTSAERLDAVITDLSEIVDVKTSGDHLKEQVDIPSVLSELYPLFESDIQQHQITIVEWIQVDTIQTIRNYFKNILFQLLSNAIKFRSAGRPAVIKVETYREKGLLIVSIADNGTGIDLKQFGGKLFGLYQRFHLHIDGKGIGLYLVKSQMQALHGTVQVESKLDGGTKFTLRFRD